MRYFGFPTDWRDEILYFLLPDRFSDGAEEPRPLITRKAIRDLRGAASQSDINWHDWATSGTRSQGGNLRGIQSKLGHLQDLGITTIEEVNRDAFARQLPPDLAHPIDAEVLLENPPDVNRQLGVPLRPPRQSRSGSHAAKFVFYFGNRELSAGHPL